MSRSTSIPRVVAAVFAALVVSLAAASCQPSRAAKSPKPQAGNEKDQARRAAARPGQSADTSAFKNMRVARAEELLAGRFAGVQVFRYPGGIAVQIRGQSSVLGSNEPLYIVDGVPVAAGPGGALLGINPEDIARIEVLKDIGSTAFYGVNGANGVVIITTKGAR